MEVYIRWKQRLINNKNALSQLKKFFALNKTNYNHLFL
jgi:hypothetical protein